MEGSGLTFIGCGAFHLEICGLLTLQGKPAFYVQYSHSHSEGCGFTLDLSQPPAHQLHSPLHYGLTEGWIQKFKTSYLTYFLQCALTDYASRKA